MAKMDVAHFPGDHVNRHILRCSVVLALSSLAMACGGERSGSSTPRVKFHHGDTLTIAMIGKSAANPVFLAARAGAEASARDLAQRNNMHIAVQWLTPQREDGDLQARSIQDAVKGGADAILISASDAGKVTPAIDDAVAHGVEVMTFDSDAPASKRFAFYGVDDYDAGQQTMAELAKAMNGKGKIGILAGNQNALNLQARVRGVTQEAAKYPGIEILGTFPHLETPQAASAEVTRENKRFPQLNGWAMIGSWALWAPSLLTELDPKRYKVVAVDALPPELDYVDKGIAPVLLAQPVYKWGTVGVETIVDRLYFKKNVPQRIPMELVRVNKENLNTWARQLKDWGFAEVPEKYLK